MTKVNHVLIFSLLLVSSVRFKAQAQDLLSVRSLAELRKVQEQISQNQLRENICQTQIERGWFPWACWKFSLRPQTELSARCLAMLRNKFDVKSVRRALILTKRDPLCHAHLNKMRLDLEYQQELGPVLDVGRQNEEANFAKPSGTPGNI